ncbi:MAG: TlpA disulfide reductase family protein [Polyangiaceae bacterium]
MSPEKPVTRRSPKREEPPMNMFAAFSYLVFVLLAGVAVYAFEIVARDGESRRRCGAICLLHPNYAAADKKAPDFTLKDMNGASVKLSSYRDKVVVLNFWNTTCGPCLEEMPEIADLTKILKEGRDDVVVLTVSTNDGPDEIRDTLKAALKNQDPPFTVLFDPDSEIVSGKYGTHLIPETWIIDKRGVIRARFDGAREWSSSAVVEMIDEIRHDGYCPVEITNSKPTGGEAAKICKEIGGIGEPNGS